MIERLSMIAFVLILASALTGTLVVVDSYTAPIIKKNEELKEKISILEALGIPYDRDDVADAFEKSVTTVERKGQKFFVSRDKVVAFKYAGSGLWGPITGVIAMQPDLKTISGITVIHQEETPGLGGRIKEKEFLDRFVSKRFEPQLVVVSPGKAAKVNEVDGITGATLSCKAFEKILNTELKRCLPLLGGTSGPSRMAPTDRGEAGR